MKVKTLLQFRSDIKKKFGWNAVIGMWYGFIYLQYSGGRFDYDHALGVIQRMASYTGN